MPPLQFSTGFRTSPPQTLVEITQIRVSAYCYECAHVEHSSNIPTATPNRALTLGLPTVAIEWGHSDQSRNCFPIQVSKLRETREQRRRCDFADSWRTA